MATTVAANERFDLGRVAARSFAVVGRHPIGFLALSLLFYGLPAYAMDHPQVQAVLGGLGYDRFWIPVAAQAFNFFVLGALAQIGITVATIQDLNGRRVDFVAAFRRSFTKFLPVLALSLVMALVTATGFVMLLIPGIIVYVMWFVALPALVEEGGGIIAATDRSRALTRGMRWPLFGLVAAYLILALLISFASTLLGTLPLGSAAPGIIAAVMAALTSMIGSTGVAAAYVELRTMKEGADTSALAEIFA